MNHFLRVALLLVTALLAIFFSGIELLRAAPTYSTLVQYRTGKNPYDANPDFGASDLAAGTALATLDFVGGGPLGGGFQFSGAAQSAPTALGVRAAVTISDYPLGSYFLIDTPHYDYFPLGGFANSSVTDRVIIEGGGENYTVRLDYRLTGVAQRGQGNYEYYFRPAMFASAAFYQGSTVVGSGGTGFYPESGPYDATVSFTAANIPSNTPLDLSQSLQLQLFSADSQYTTDIDPYETGDWDPSHITYSTTLIGEDPYSVTTSADFGHTLQLTLVTILDASGQIASDAVLVSENGVNYPGQGVEVPEPSALELMGGAVAALLGIWRSRRRSLSHVR